AVELMPSTPPRHKASRPADASTDASSGRSTLPPPPGSRSRPASSPGRPQTEVPSRRRRETDTRPNQAETSRSGLVAVDGHHPCTATAQSHRLEELGSQHPLGFPALHSNGLDA